MENKKESKFKGLLKKTEGAFVLGALISSLAFWTFCGAAAIKSAVSINKYNPPAYVQEVMADFDVDNDYLSKSNKGYYKRLEDNGKDPIYVSIDKSYDSYPEYKQYVIDALDYLFGIVGKINLAYKYKIVSEAERIGCDMVGKSTIKFTSGSIPSAPGGLISGTEESAFSFYDVLSKDNNILSSIIKLDFDVFNKRDEEANRYTTIHELMHAFGFDDMYQVTVVDGLKQTTHTSKYKGDTFMQVVGKNRVMKITPNDFALLCALYIPKGSDEQYKADIKKMIEDYKQEYYNHYNDLCLELVRTKSMFEDRTILPPTQKLKSVKGMFTYGDKDLNDVEVTYVVKLDKDKYRVELYEKDVLLDSCEGDVLRTENFLILKSCTLKNGMTPKHIFNHVEEGYIQDIPLFICDDKYLVLLLPHEGSYSLVYKATFEAEDSNELNN